MGFLLSGIDVHLIENYEHPQGLFTPLKNIAAEVSMLAIRATVPERSGGGHPLCFYHSSDLIQDSQRFGFKLLSQVKDYGIALRDQVNEAFRYPL
jgi:hypothetical protein